MAQFNSEQEAFWASDFGTEYRQRNNSVALYHSKVAAFGRMLKSASKVDSVIELGCNIGLNLRALRGFNPNLTLTGIEINSESAQVARETSGANIITGSILQSIDVTPAALTFTMGVLIHIAPDDLEQAYANLVSLSTRYVLVAEYYNPSPVSIDYRGHSDRLFKRDFAGELIDKYGLGLVDYGFFYKRDHWAPMDDITWFLLEK